MAHKQENHPGLAAVMSFFIPGLGQLYSGRLGMAAVLFAGTVAIPVLITVVAFAFLAAGAQSGNMEAGATGAIGMVYIVMPLMSFCFWVWNIIDAYSNANGSSTVSSRRMRSGGRGRRGGGGRRHQTSRRMRREDPPEAPSDEEIERFGAASDSKPSGPAAPRKRRRRRR